MKRRGTDGTHFDTRVCAMNEDDEEKKSSPKGTEFLSRQIFAARSIFIFGPIDQHMAKDVCAQLVALSQAGDEDVKIYINSPGGHVESGDTIYDFIKFVRPTIKVIGTGYVASAAALIFVGAKRQNRYCLPQTRFMIHQPSGGVGGRATDIEIQAAEIIKMKERLNQTFARETGQPIERVRRDAERDYWMDTKEAIEYGILGSVIKSIRDI
jgi:ATP-dependent Clp protease protease subunit